MARNSRKRKLGWLVATTHEHSELEARRHLSRQGYEVELPLMRTEPNRLGVRRVVALFEGYVFVRETKAWWSIRNTRGVSSLLMNCGEPAKLADDDLQFFLSDSVDDAGYYIDPVTKLHRVGDTVVPRSGRFAGSAGLLTQMQSSGRVEVLFSLLGREVRTTEYRVTELA
jgi:transcription antitermination factor NusG